MIVLQKMLQLIGFKNHSIQSPLYLRILNKRKALLLSKLLDSILSLMSNNFEKKEFEKYYMIQSIDCIPQMIFIIYILMKEKFTNRSLHEKDISTETLQTQCRLHQRPKDSQPALRNSQNNQKIVRICRICLQSQQIGKNLYGKASLYSQVESNPIIQLPCACKGQLGMIHDKCIKFWIKMWLQAKLNALSLGSTEIVFSSEVIQELENQNRQQNTDNCQQNKKQAKFRQLNIKNLKQDSIYPFPCQICHQPILFDLKFHTRLKKYAELTTKDLILFSLPLIFMISFLGICINWFIQSGISLNLILFFTLVWFPLFAISVAIGAWTFTQKQFWVQGIYDRKDALARYEVKNQYLKSLKILKQANQSKKQNFKFLKRQFDNIRNKILRRKLKQKSLEKQITPNKLSKSSELQNQRVKNLDYFKSQNSMKKNANDMVPDSQNDGQQMIQIQID